MPALPARPVRAHRRALAPPAPPLVAATRNLPLEMVCAGWGIVYMGVGAQCGGWGQAAFFVAQAEAQYVFVCFFFFFFVLTSPSRAGRHSLTDTGGDVNRGRRAGGIWHAGTARAGGGASH